MAKSASPLKRAAAQVLPLLSRPYPPEAMMPSGGVLPGVEKCFVPAPEVVDWITRAFLDEAGALHDPEHGHLRQAHIACLWTSIGNERQGRRIVGMAEMPGRSSRGGKWLNARATYQLVQWFGAEPDFLITLDALYAEQADDVTFCALVDHELRHCAQATDDFGAPKFIRATGLPAFTIRGHDVEEFTATVRRFGAGPDVQALIDAAARAPEVAPARIAQACGTCQRRAA